MIEYDEKSWKDDEDDYWKDAAKDVAKDDEGHLVLSEEGKRIDGRWYQRGWTLVVGGGVLVALVAALVYLAVR